MNIKIYDNTNDLITDFSPSPFVMLQKKPLPHVDSLTLYCQEEDRPRKHYKLLASEPYKNQIDWENTYFFFGDERFVAKGHSQRNSLMAKKSSI